MKDTREQILSTKRTHRVFVPTQVPPNCSAGRCGHKSIAIPKIAFTKDDVLNSMDEYALLILQWMFDNGQDLTCESDFNAKEYLQEIKTSLNEKYNKEAD